MFASNYFETAMLNLLRGSNNNITAPTKLYLSLFLTNPGDSGTEGTEITYSGYARQEISFSAPAVDGTGLEMHNSADITFAQATTNAGTVNYVAVFDNATVGAGNMWLYGQLDTPLTVQSGVAPVFRSETVKWIWTGNLTTFYRTAIMNTLRGTSLSGFSPYVGFCNGDPTGNGSEFSGNNYARAAMAFSAPVQPSGTAAATIANSTEVITGVSTGNWGTLNTVALFDASVNGNAFAVVALPNSASFSVTAGYQLGFHVGDFTFSVN